jgi:hypothetical protein
VFSGFYFKNTVTIRDLMKRYKDLEALARRVFPMLKLSEASDGIQEPDSTQQGLAESFVAAAEQLEENLCDLVSRGVLTCGRTAGARSSEFETIGSMVNVSPGHLSDRIVGLYVVLAMWYMGLMMYLQRPHPKLTGLVIATSYVAAIWPAFRFKRWEWARPEGDNLPIRGYVLSAVAAFGLASLSSFGFGVLTGSGVLKTWDLLGSRFWPWSLMSAFVAACVACLIDQKERPGIRWQETVAVSLGCALWAIPVIYLLHDGCGCASPPYWRVMTVSALTGGLIGFFVPTWYRSPLRTVSWYEGFKVVLTTRTDPDTGVVAEIAVFPRQLPGVPRLHAEQLPSVEAISTDDAIALAIQSARAWINVRQRQRQSDSSVATAAALRQRATSSLKAMV